MHSRDSEARFGPALNPPPKVIWVLIVGAVACLLIFAPPAASQAAAGSRVTPPPFLATGSSVALPGLQAEASQESLGSISGTITSNEGNPIAGAEVTLTRGNQSAKQQVVSDDNGHFFFTNVVPGPFQLAITAPPFESQTYSGVLAAGQHVVVPPIELALATVATVVTVYPPAVKAAHEVKEEEKQRVLGFIPNFYVSYAPNPVPLSFKQKLDLAWKSTTDPIVVGGVAAFAGIAQGKDWFNAYGQGTQGYAKRFGATYGDVFIGTFLDSAIFPTLFKQDPRYFYKGTGSWKSRLVYALTRSFVLRGDNGHWQPNYSTLLGNITTGAIAYPYRTPRDQTVGFIFQTTGIRFAEEALGNVFEEFFSRKLTPSLFRKDKSRSVRISGRACKPSPHKRERDLAPQGRNSFTAAYPCPRPASQRIQSGSSIFVACSEGSTELQRCSRARTSLSEPASLVPGSGEAQAPVREASSPASSSNHNAWGTTCVHSQTHDRFVENPALNPCGAIKDLASKLL